MTTVIDSTDPRLGRRGDKGEIVKWPEVNVNGVPCHRNDGAQQYVGDRYFVIVPVGVVMEDIVVREIASKDEAAPVAPPAKGNVDDGKTKRLDRDGGNGNPV